MLDFLRDLWWAVTSDEKHPSFGPKGHLSAGMPASKGFTDHQGVRTPASLLRSTERAFRTQDLGATQERRVPTDREGRHGLESVCDL